MRFIVTALLSFGIIHICQASILFHSNFESEGFHTSRAIKAGAKTIELLPHSELNLWWPLDGGKGIISPGFSEHQESFQYESRSGTKLKGITGITQNHNKWASVRAWGLAEWYADLRLMQSHTNGKIELDENTPISGSHSALIQADFHSSAFLQHRVVASRNGRLAVRFAIRFEDDLALTWNGNLPVLHCEMEGDLALRVAATHQRNANAIQFAFVERPHVEIIRRQRFEAIPVVGKNTYDVEVVFEPTADSVCVCSLRVNGKVQSVITARFGPRRSQTRRTLAFGKIGNHSYPVSLWLDDVYVSDFPLGKIPRQTTLACSSDHLVAGSEIIDKGIALAAHWQISADRNWLLPAFSSGQDPFHIHKLPPLGSISIPRRGMKRIVFDSAVPMPFEIPKSDQFWARIRHMSRSGVWGPWSLPVAIGPAMWQSIAERGIQGIDNAYFTKPGSRSKIARLQRERWYDLHFRFPPKSNPGFLDACLNGNPEGATMSCYERGGVFESKDNYVVSMDLKHRAVWAIEDEGSARHNILFGDSGKYCDDTPGKSLYDPQGGRARIRIRLLRQARTGTWKLLAYLTDRSLGVSPAHQNLFFVGNDEASVPGLRLPYFSLSVIGGILLATGFMIGLVWLLKIYARPQAKRSSTIDLTAPPSKCKNEHVRKSVEYIQSNLPHPISLREVADAVGISPRGLRKAFQSEFGSGVLEYIHATKMRKAKQLLRESSHTVNEIAIQVGFNSITSFNRTFKRHAGSTPLEYRKNA